MAGEEQPRNPPRIAVLIPARVKGDGWRTRALSWVLAHFTGAHPGWRISVAGPEREAWSKGDALSRARGHKTEADVYVVTDADVVTDPSALTDAVSAVLARSSIRASSGKETAQDSPPFGNSWALPHRKVWRLDEASTTLLYETGSVPDGAGLDRAAYLGIEGGGLTVLTREALDACPIDPRFEGYGSEDVAWGQALRTLYGPPWRGDAHLWHLWHPTSRVESQSKNLTPAGKALARRYYRANGDPEAMRVLLDEASRV